MISRYAQLKASGELGKTRTPKHMTPEERQERWRIESQNRRDRKNAHANAQVRLVNAHSAAHRKLLENESHYLRFDPSFPRSATKQRFEAEARRRAIVVLRYDYGFEYEKYFAQEFMAIKNGFRNAAEQRKNKRVSLAKARASYSLTGALSVACISLIVAIGVVAKDDASRWYSGGSEIAEGDVRFTTYVGPFQQEKLVIGRQVSIGSLATGESGLIYDHSGEIVAMASGMSPVKNDHKGERKPIPSDPTNRCPQFETTLAAYGLFPIDTWSYIAWRESRCNPDAQNAEWDANGNMTYALNKNGTYDTGLVQINSSWKTAVREICGPEALENNMQGLKDVDCNLRVARFIMENTAGGLANWRL
jgi:hypothetical protein